MRRFLAAAAALLLVVLGSQAVLAEYQPNGSLICSSLTPTAGGTMTVSGSGFAPNSPVQIVITSTPVLLDTVGTDSSGAFSAEITIPVDLVGAHTLTATGTDPQGSVRVLSTDITVIAPPLPATSTVPGVAAPQDRSDSMVFALAGMGIVLMTGGLLYSTRRRRQRR